MKKKIVIAHGHTSIEILHSLVPLILLSSKDHNFKISFVDYKLSNIFKIEGDLLILLRKYHNKNLENSLIISEIKKLKKNFTKVIYFDDSASPLTITPCILPYVDRYWKRSILKDKKLYQNQYYGGRLFSDFYHKKFNINDTGKEMKNLPINNIDDFKKIQVAWNIGAGIFPLNKQKIVDLYYPFFRKLITAMSILPSIQPINLIISNQINRMILELKKEINFKYKQLKFISRFKPNIYTYTVGFQRQLLLNKIENNKNFLTGHKKRREFTEETFNSFGIISPFGWGEICYRDFEATLGGSFLIKPDVSHMNTWPDIYEPDMYHSIQWDLDKIENLEFLFDQKKNCENAVNKARYKYLDSLKYLEIRCRNLINEII